MGYTANEKALLDSDSSIKTVKISFPNLDIEDIETDRIYEQEMSMEEALCDSEDLVYGKCNASVFKVKVADFTDDVLNQEMSVEVSYHKDGLALEDKTEQVGKYIVSSMAKSSDRRYRIITAYDFMVKFDIDIAQWYKEVLFPDGTTTRTVNTVLQMLCSYCGVAYDSNYTLINGSVVVGRTVDPTTLKGRTLLECICELNAVFGHVDPTGTLRFIALTPINNPEDVINTYKECTYEDYEVKPINCLQIKTEEDDIGVTVTTSSHSSANENMYVITGNILTYDLSSQNLNLVATRILDAIKDITYVPCSTTVKGHVYMSLGTPYSIVGRYDTVESYVTKRVISGIGSITTNLQSHGNALRDKESYSLIDEVKRIAGKAAKLRSDVDGISAELVDYEESSSTAIQATAEGLAAEIIRAQGAEGQLQTNIEATAEGIRQSVSATYATKSNTITSDTIHYLATSLASGVTTSTSGWSTQPQSVTSTEKYLWTYHTYTYADSTQARPHTIDTTPVITGVYGDRGQQGESGAYVWNNLPAIDDVRIKWGTKVRIKSYSYDYSNGTYTLVTNTPSSGTQQRLYTAYMPMSLELQGQQCTLSIDEFTSTYADGVPRVYVGFASTSSGTGSSSWYIQPGTKTKTFTVPNDARYYRLYLYCDYGTSAPEDTVVTFKGIKLELGNTATTWTPNPNDLSALDVLEVKPLYYLNTLNATPSAPTSEVTSTSTSAETWTTVMPTLTATARYVFTCDQTKYTGNNFAWSAPVLNQYLTDLDSRMTTAENKITDSAIINTVTSNMKVGGRNLLLDSETRQLILNPSSGNLKPTIAYATDQTVEEWGATNAIRAYGSLAEGATSRSFGSLRNPSGKPNRDCIVGTPYVHSVFVKNNHATNSLSIDINALSQVNPSTGVTDKGLIVHLYNPSPGEDADIIATGQKTYTLAPGKIARVIITSYGTTTSGGVVRALQLTFQTESTSYKEFDFTYWHPQIEVGDIVTEWQPAPDDNAKQSIVEQLADRLSLILSSESSSSVVVLTPDALDAIVNNINLNGRVNFSGLDNSAQGRMSYYGTCSTSANTAEKAVAITGFTDEMLQAGTKISVYFSEGNSVNYATLKINSGTSKNIFAVNERLTSASRYNWLANSTVDFVYTGSVWRICDNNAGAIMDNIYVVGKTTINGGVIETKSVKAAQVDVVDLLAQEITSTGSIRGVTIISTETVNGVTYINTMAAGKNDIKTTNYLKSILSCGDFSGYASNELDASGVLKLYKGNVSKSGTMNDADARMTLLSPSSLYVGIDKDFRTEADIETGHIFGSIFGNRMAANAVVAKKSMVCGGFSVPNSCGSGNNKILSSTGTTEWTSLYSLSGLSSSGSLDLVTIGPESWHKFGELTLSKGKYVFVSTATLSAGPGNTYSDGFAGLGITTGSTTKTSFLQYDTKVNVKAGSVAIQNIRMLTCSSSTKVNVYGIQTIGTAISVTPGYMFLRMPG